MIEIKTGIKILHHRVYATIRTGDEAADLIIKDLEKKVNENADRIEILENELEESKKRGSSAFLLGTVA